MTWRTSLKNYLTHTGGTVAMWGVFAMPVIIGGAALSVDASRLYNMDHDLQSASDALARAGAAELDQRSDSIQRATRAIQNLVSNEQKFSKMGSGEVEIDTIRYLKSLPDKDYMDVTNEYVTNNPSEAKYVEVAVKPHDVSTMFPVTVVNKITDVTLSAKSTAGFDQSVCEVAPVFICNPVENTGVSIYAAMEDPAFRRQQIKLKTSGGNNAQYGPGNFGWLDPYGGNSGASQLREAVAVDVPPTCFNKSAGVVLRPGNISSMRHAMNTRFDIYEGSYSGKKNDPAYAPAENVTRAATLKANICAHADVDLESVKFSAGVFADVNVYIDGIDPLIDANLIAQAKIAYPLPRDKCFYDGSCDRIGDGDWDFVTYLKVNHNFMSPITIEGVTYTINYNNNTFTPAEPPSRYNMYRWEIDNNSVPGSMTYGSSAITKGEGLPICHASGPSTTVPDRRVIHAAVLNCEAIEAQGEAMNGRTDPIPAETFVKVFVTEPMGNSKDNTLWGEVIGPVVQGYDPESRDQIALVR